MSERTAFKARREAMRSLATGRLDQHQHDSAMQIYLAGTAYLASRQLPMVPSEEPAQPVDEPVPMVPEELCR